MVQRTRELGVRIALGASEGMILRLVMCDGLTFVLAGAVAGILGALASTRVIRSMLFDTTPADATTFIAVPIVLTLAATVASYLSARRAQTDPMVAIKGE